MRIMSGVTRSRTCWRITTGKSISVRCVGISSRSPWGREFVCIFDVGRHEQKYTLVVGDEVLVN